MEKPLVTPDPSAREPRSTPTPKGGILLGRPFGIALRLDVSWFLISAAQRSILSLELRETLRRYRVGQVTRSDCPRVPPGETLREFVDERILRTVQRCFLVTDGEVLMGLVTLHEVNSVTRDAWPTTAVGDVMVPLGRVGRVGAEEPLVKAFEKMEESDVNQLPIMEDGRVKGFVTREDVLRVLGTDLELRGA